jgi:hypothetical protein
MPRTTGEWCEPSIFIAIQCLVFVILAFISFFPVLLRVSDEVDDLVVKHAALELGLRLVKGIEHGVDVQGVKLPEKLPGEEVAKGEKN